MLSTFMAVLPVFPPRWDAGFTVVDANYSTSEWFNLKTTKALGLNVLLHLQQLADVVIEQAADVCLWPKADILIAWANVCFRG
jgi:hypothetical protein